MKEILHDSCWVFMNILITGATGFIGQYLWRTLVARHNVFGVTRTVTASPVDAEKLIIADLSCPRFTESLPVNIDCVIHLAQSGRYRDFPEGVDDVNRINIDATVSLLEWSRKTGVKQFVFTSSANVYEESATVLAESHSTQPSSFYGASKLAVEHLARQYQAFFQVDILRCFTVYGPNQKGMLIPNIIEKIMSGKPITLAEGTGIYLSPIYVKDVADIIHRLITSSAMPVSRLMNVCGDQIITLNQIVRLLEKILEKSAIIQVTDDEATHFMGSNTILKNYLGVYQFVDIQNGLELTCRSYCN